VAVVDFVLWSLENPHRYGPASQWAYIWWRALSTHSRYTAVIELNLSEELTVCKIRTRIIRLETKEKDQ
jgi:hypothetical protein